MELSGINQWMMSNKAGFKGTRWKYMTPSPEKIIFPFHFTNHVPLLKAPTSIFSLSFFSVIAWDMWPSAVCNKEYATEKNVALNPEYRR